MPRALATPPASASRGPWAMAGLIVVAMSLAGCTTLGGGPALALPGTGDDGGDVRAAIIAEMKGGLIGGSIGEGLDEDEKARALEAEYRALEYTPAGQKVAWSGSEPARRGEVVAAQPYRVGTQDCRQYKQTVFTEGGSQTARGAACRNSDGSWTPLT